MKILFLIFIMILILITSITQTFAEEISDAITSLFSYDVQTGELAIMWLGNHQKGSLEGYASAGF